MEQSIKIKLIELLSLAKGNSKDPSKKYGRVAYNGQVFLEGKYVPYKIKFNLSVNVVKKDIIEKLQKYLNNEIEVPEGCFEFKEGSYNGVAFNYLSLKKLGTIFNAVDKDLFPKETPQEIVKNFLEML